MNTNTKYIVVAGGVISGVGKGVTTASIGKILKEHGYRVTIIKIDPYINFDAGTLRPTEHGEVWVTEDGGEIDQDLGTYERFIDEDIPKKNNITTGQIYKAVIDRERRGEYLGQTVQFIPHITNEISDRIKDCAQGFDIAIIEIGGTVGDYENSPFFFALKAIERELGADSVAYILVTFLPVPNHISEMKTKPTQQAIRMLGEQSIIADFIICRSEFALDDVRRKKIEEFAHIKSDHIIAAPDLTCVYQMPLKLEEQELGKKLLEHLKLPVKKMPNWQAWQLRADRMIQASERIKLAIIGKYLDIGAFHLTDSYISICHALQHAGAELDVSIDISWIDSKTFDHDGDVLKQLAGFDGIIIPGGFGNHGVEGKINAIAYARKNNIPYLGLCYGMQLAVVEFARNVASMQGAHTTEVDKQPKFPVIDILPLQKQLLNEGRYGGTMRLGAFGAVIKKDSMVQRLYLNRQAIVDEMVHERHRHRYEVNPAYVRQLEQKGLVFSGYHERIDGTRLMEFLELPRHRFFVATQAHPEFKSRLGNPNPLFFGFVAAASEYAAEKVRCADVPFMQVAKNNNQVSL